MSTSSSARGAAWAAAAILAVIAGFQVYWGLGGSWGLHEASGGALDDPSTFTRVLSVIAGLVFLAMGGVLLRRVGYLSERMPFKLARIGAWVIAVAFALGALGNFGAQTDFERFVDGSVALIVALLAFVVARSPSPVSPPRGIRPPTRKPGAPTPVH